MEEVGLRVVRACGAEALRCAVEPPRETWRAEYSTALSRKSTMACRNMMHEAQCQEQSL